MEMLRQHPRTHVYNGRMRKPVALIPLLFALSGLLGCDPGKNAVVVLDDQWAVKQAHADCQSRLRDGVPLCTGDPTAMIRDLEARTIQSFKMSTACHGLTLVTLNVSEDPSRVNSRHTRWLFLELIRSNMPDENELRYTVSDTQEGYESGTKGQGKADSIAAQFCDVIRRGPNLE